MPELPEVETVRRALEPRVKGLTIASVDIHLPRMIRTHTALEFASIVKNQTIQSIQRRGKHLIFVLDDGYVLSHLRMEGKYYFTDESIPKMVHEHVRIHFTSGAALIYHDVRTFGTFDYFTKRPFEEIPLLKPLGKEPFDDGFDGAYLKAKFQAKKGPIKPVLLDQTIILGLGNIYADEVLFCAGIHPKRAASNISLKRLETLAQCTKDILKNAVRLGGTTIRTYESTFGIDGMFQNELYVHTLEHEPCRICGTQIKRIKLAGRSTYYCVNCQH